MNQEDRYIINTLINEISLKNKEIQELKQFIKEMKVKEIHGVALEGLEYEKAIRDTRLLIID